MGLGLDVQGVAAPDEDLQRVQQVNLAGHL